MANTKLPARLLDTSAIPALNVTGDLTVDTTTLKVDSTNNRVGIGVASPAGLPLQTKVSSGDNKLRMTTASKDAFILELKDASGDVHLGTNTTAGAIVIADGGKVGIGTNNPSTKLTVKNDNATTSFGDNNIITIQNANTTDNSRMGLAFTGNTNVGSGLALVEGVSYDQSQGHTSLNFSVYNGSWHNDMMVLKAGRVGIGETDPDFKLHVKDTNTQIAIESTTTNQNSSLYYIANGANQWETGVNITAGLDYEIYDRVNNGARMVVQHDGKIRIGNNIPMWSGAYGGALVLKGNNATSDRYAQLTVVDSSGSIAYTGLIVNNTGNVGIGTNNPQKLTHIRGAGDGTHLRIARNGVSEWDFSIGNTSTLSGVGSGALEILPQNGNSANEFAIGQAGTTASMLHLHAYGMNLPKQTVFSAALPAVTNGGNTIVWGGEHLDVGGNFNTSNGRFTAPIGGNYFFSFWLLLDPSGAGNYSRVLFKKNGSVSTQWTDNLESTDAGATAAYHSVGGSAVIPMAANDYIELHNDGQNPTYGTSYGNFSGFLVS